MKGISTIMATILLVTITIGLITTAYLFIGGILTGATAEVFEIIDVSNDKVLIRNMGVKPIEKFYCLVDGIEIACDIEGGSIPAGDVGSLNLTGITEGRHELVLGSRSISQRFSWQAVTTMPTCTPDGSPCTRGDECCNGNCTAGSCAVCGACGTPCSEGSYTYDDGTHTCDSFPAICISKLGEGQGDCDCDANCQSGLYCDQIDPGNDYCCPVGTDWDGSNCVLPGPVGFWKFDEGNGTTAYDSSGNNNHGVFYGESFNDGKLGDGTCDPGSAKCPARIGGYFGKALSFDGVDDFVKILDSTSLDLNNSFTVEFWLKWSQYNYRTVMAKGAYDTSFGWFVRWASNTAYFRVRDSGTNTADATMNINLYDDQWHHFVGLRDGNTVRIFIDGNEGTPADASTVGTILNNYAVTIGTRGDETTKPPTGIFDEVRIWDKVLTQTEIQAEMQSSLPVERPVASWSFEEEDNARYANDTHIWVNGTHESALSFDGSNDYVRVPAGFLPTSAITVELWLKPLSASTTSWKKYIGAGPTTTSGLYGGQTTLNPDALWSLRLSWDSKTLSCGPVTAPTNDWSHLAVTWNSTYCYGYVNGNIVTEGAISGTPDWSGSPLYLGANNGGGENFHGIIDEVKIYDRALTQAEIQADM